MSLAQEDNATGTKIEYYIKGKSTYSQTTPHSSRTTTGSGIENLMEFIRIHKEDSDLLRRLAYNLIKRSTAVSSRQANVSMVRSIFSL
jgi:hypothetical protein